MNDSDDASSLFMDIFVYSIRWPYSIAIACIASGKLDAASVGFVLILSLCSPLFVCIGRCPSSIAPPLSLCVSSVFATPFDTVFQAAPIPLYQATYLISMQYTHAVADPYLRHAKAYYKNDSYHS